MQIKTLTLSIGLAFVSSGALAMTHVLATETASGKQIAVTLDSTSTVNKFGNISVTPITTNTTAEIAKFFGPDPKRVLVRTYSVYNELKKAALADSTTTPERIAATEVVVVPELAAMYGINNIDNYAVERGLVTKGVVNSLADNDMVLTLVFNDITMRAAGGELKPVNQELS